MVFSQQVINKLLQEIEQNEELKHRMLGRMLSDIKHRHKRLDQLNRMWKSLPEGIQKSESLSNHLTSFHDGNFRGALGNLITGWVLSQYIKNLKYEPLIAGRTPDFYARTQYTSFFVEAFYMSQEIIMRQFDDNMSRFLDELKTIKGEFFIFLQGTPVPNDQGNFNGMGEALLSYVANLGDWHSSKRAIHKISHNGAFIKFTLHPRANKGLVYMGATLGFATGDPNPNRFIRRLQKKLDNYPFPIVISSILESSIIMDPKSLYYTLIGQPIYTIPVPDYDTPIDADNIKATPSNSQDGFWGQKNSNFGINLRIHAVLFIRVIFNHDHTFSLALHIAENPYLRIGLRNVFREIPDIFVPSSNTPGPKQKPLILSP